jgi:NAD(P)-dependent dehydrogenase (short-subunit alcohol dehydrogenase family)
VGDWLSLEPGFPDLQPGPKARHEAGLRRDRTSSASPPSECGFGGANRAAYASSKAGLLNLTRCLAIEWQPLGIRVNAVAQSFVCTPLTEQLLAGGLDVQNRTLGNDLPEPWDVARDGLLPGQRAARMITSQVLAVDGGWSAW